MSASRRVSRARASIRLECRSRRSECWVAETPSVRRAQSATARLCSAARAQAVVNDDGVDATTKRDREVAR